MKIKLVYCVLFLSFVGCNAQKTTKMEQDIIIPEVTNELEIFDINKYTLEKENSFVKEGEQLVKRMSQSFGYAVQIIYPKSHFSIIKLYHKNYNLKEKGVSFNNGSEYGVWYEFDKQGNFVKEINTDKGYDFGWDKILEYCHKNDIILEKGYPKQGGIKTEIYKNEEDGNKVWFISYYNYKKEQYLGVTLDGKTGELIKEQVIEFEGS